MEEKFYTGNTLQNKMFKLYSSGFDINSITDNVDDKELKELLIETRESGYKAETAESMFFPIINYGLYKKYSPYVTADMKDYIDIMATESDKAQANKVQPYTIFANDYSLRLIV